MVPMTVTPMPRVPIPKDPSAACAMKATLGMAKLVQVGPFSEIHSFITLQVPLPIDF